VPLLSLLTGATINPHAQINGREYEAANLTTLPHNFRVLVGKTSADSFLLNLGSGLKKEEQATSLGGFKDAFGGTTINWCVNCLRDLRDLTRRLQASIDAARLLPCPAAP